jgi:hypothetical protein
MPNAAVAFDFDRIAVPFRMQPGLRRMAPGTSQLTPASPGSRHLREKMAVLAVHADEALVATPDFDATPALQAIARDASASSPTAFTYASPLDAAAPRLGWSVRQGRPEGAGDSAIGVLLEGLPEAQRVTALLCLAFDEDFAAIDAATAVIPWIAVCLPSRWAPQAKIGRHFAEVHAPVADNARLLEAAEGLSRLVAGPDRWERFVWTVAADPRLHQHPARGETPWPVDADSESIVAMASLRHERQTFIPVPETGQSVFTIRVESEPLDRAVRTREDAARLHGAIASMSDAVLAYRGLAPVRDRLLEALARRIASRPAAGG